MRPVLHPLGPSFSIRHFYISEEWYDEYFPSSGPWVDVDKWLARMTLRTEVKRSLRVVLMQEQGDRSVWEGYIPEFRKAGGEVKIETKTDDD